MSEENLQKAVQTLAKGLGVTESDEVPRFLEAIAISLGFSQQNVAGSLANSATRIADALERIADQLDSRG